MTADDPRAEDGDDEEPFPGIPPEELPSKEEPLPDDEVPPLEPEFMEALRQAGRGDLSQGGETVEFNPYPGEAPAEGSGPGETVEYSVEDLPQAPEPSPPPEPPAPAPEPPAPASPPEPPVPPPPVPAPEPPALSPETPASQPAAPEPPAPPAPPSPAPEPAPAVPPPPPAPDRTAVMPGAREHVQRALAEAEQEGIPYSPPRPPAGGAGDPPPKPKRLWWRFALGSLLIVLAFASATTAASVMEVMSWVDDFQDLPNVDPELVPPEPGEPQTFLLLGSDRRLAEDDAPGLSDTTILLRLDPDKNRIAILNIPRDLKVDIPGYGTNKFNAAYALGGPRLTVRTIKSITRGMHLFINHVVNINFLGFAQAINAIDCVYIDVDRDYFHSNAGVPAELQYDEIDIDPGYQRLCGADALDYARYRHTDTDLVRAARQQNFLREARSRVPYVELFKNRDELFGIFAKHTQSDISEFDEAIAVIRLMINSINSPIEEVRFPATLGPSYVYASRSDIEQAVRQFLDIEGSGGPRGTLDDPQGGSDTAAGGATDPDAGGDGRNRQPRPESDGLVDTDFGLEVAKSLTPRLSPEFSVFYPRRLPEGSVYEEPRAYYVNDDSGVGHQAYRMVLTVQLPDGIHYVGVQGIRDWEEPPILSDPSETVEMNGREFDVYLESDRIRLVAWHDDDDSYWVSNSLLNTLTNDQMLGIARSMGDIAPKPKPRNNRRQRRGSN